MLLILKVFPEIHQLLFLPFKQSSSLHFIKFPLPGVFSSIFSYELPIPMHVVFPKLSSVLTPICPAIESLSLFQPSQVFSFIKVPICPSLLPASILQVICSLPFIFASIIFRLGSHPLELIINSLPFIKVSISVNEPPFSISHVICPVP